MQWISNDIKATELASHMQELYRVCSAIRTPIQLRSHSNGNHGQGLTYKNRSMGRENQTTLPSLLWCLDQELECLQDHLEDLALACRDVVGNLTELESEVIICPRPPLGRWRSPALPAPPRRSTSFPFFPPAGHPDRRSADQSLRTRGPGSLPRE